MEAVFPQGRTYTRKMNGTQYSPRTVIKGSARGQTALWGTEKLARTNTEEHRSSGKRGWVPGT